MNLWDLKTGAFFRVLDGNYKDRVGVILREATSFLFVGEAGGRGRDVDDYSFDFEELSLEGVEAALAGVVGGIPLRDMPNASFATLLNGPEAGKVVIRRCSEVFTLASPRWVCLTRHSEDIRVRPLKPGDTITIE